MAMIALPFQQEGHRSGGPVSGPGDGDVQIGLDILDHYILRAGKFDLNPAALILASGAVLTVKAHRDLAQMVIGPAKREAQAPFGALAQAVGHFKTSCLNADLHEVTPDRVRNNMNFMGEIHFQQSD